MRTGPTCMAGVLAMFISAGSSGLAASMSATKGVDVRMPESRVNFSYSFAPPHRITVARPSSSCKTLVDVCYNLVRYSWSYESLADRPVGIYGPPPTTHFVDIWPEIDGRRIRPSNWTRTEDVLPILNCTFDDETGRVELEVTGGATGAIARVHFANKSRQPHRFSLVCEANGPSSYTFPKQQEGMAYILTSAKDRSDRVALMACGMDRSSADRDERRIRMHWDVQPKAKATGWLVRPGEAYAADLPVLQSRSWDKEAAAAKSEWRDLCGKAVRIEVPDPGIERAFYASLADIYVMREPLIDNRVGVIAGTEVYRFAGTFETAIAAIALDQAGLHRDAEIGYQPILDRQMEDGNWMPLADAGGSMWSAPGFKSWAVMEHYQLTKDRAYLERVYPRMLASSRWQEKQRALSRVLKDGVRLPTYGLMPPGHGDCGLIDSSDPPGQMLYHVFYPHNIWSVYADRATMEVAQILGRTEDLPELQRIYEQGHMDLLESLKSGSIEDSGHRWIPGPVGKASGSRWGALNIFFPCRLLPGDHELVTGTIWKMESRLSPGGLPMHTGFVENGMWVAIGLDNLGEARLARGDADSFVKYLYATINHATPLYTWSEERLAEASTPFTTGDREHLWGPVAVVRAVRDSLVMEDGDGLHLARGTARDWLGSGKRLGISKAPTHFGQVSFHIQYSASEHRVRGEMTFPKESSMAWSTLHLRLPNGLRVTSVNAASGAETLHDGSGITWKRPSGRVSIEAEVGTAR